MTWSSNMELCELLSSLLQTPTAEETIWRDSGRNVYVQGNVFKFYSRYV